MKHRSIIREGEYEKLGTLIVDGSILDLGGNSDSDYHALIGGEHTFTSVNINPQYGCDMVFDIQKPFPLAGGQFDAVLSLNVLEHIYKFNNVLAEASRVLRKNGLLILSVPFMHHIHGSPDDYFRYTRSALEEMLTENKFGDIMIEEIGSGLFSLLYQSSAGMFPNFLKGIFKGLSISADAVLCRLSKRYRDVSKRIPLGYFVTAKKV